MAATDVLRGRQTATRTLTNKSGGGVVQGDVVVIGDGTNDNAFTTTTSASFTARMIGVAMETIASDAAGLVAISGYVPIVNSAASLTRDQFLFTSTVAKEATASATRAAGAFGQVLETGTDPEAIIWGMPDSSSPAGLGAWTTYTPTWTSSGTAPTIGNGTLTGLYRLLDTSSMQIIIRFVMGSTSNDGTGTYQLSMPSGYKAANVAAPQAVSGRYLDSGTAHFVGIGYIDPGTTAFYGMFAHNTSTSVNQIWGEGYPVVLATGDEVNISGILRYEVV